MGRWIKLCWRTACETCDGVRHMHQTVGIELHTATRRATLIPAKVL